LPHFSVSFLKSVVVEDFDAAEAIWRHAVEGVLQVDAVEHPLMLVESTFNDAARREKMCEIVMEAFGCPATFIAKDAVLSAFAAGRSTALVLQSGAGLTSAVAVNDGYALMQGGRFFP
jgi:actin-related protein